MRIVLPNSTGRADLPIATGVIAAGRLLFVSGQGPIDRETGSLISGTFEDQARLTLDNLAFAAAAAGTDLSCAVKVNAYLRDMSNFATFNEVYRGYFGEEWPARTTVQSDLPGFEIEIDAIIDVDSPAESH